MNFLNIFKIHEYPHLSEITLDFEKLKFSMLGEKWERLHIKFFIKNFYYKFIKQKNKIFYHLHFYIIYNIFIEKDWLEKK